MTSGGVTSCGIRGVVVVIVIAGCSGKREAPQSSASVAMAGEKDGIMV